MKLGRCLICSLVLVFLVFSRADAAETVRPNVVFIVADDLGYGELGSYGQKWIQTPILDQLAHDGIRLTNHYAGSPVCAPSRAAIFTGQHSGHAEIRHNREILPEGQWPIQEGTVTLAELFQDLGYKTGLFGKWGLGSMESDGSPLNQGFNRFFGFNCQRQAHQYYPTYLWDDNSRIGLPNNPRSKQFQNYAPDTFVEHAIEFIQSNSEDPFFLFYATTVPHLPLQVPDDSIAPYIGKFPDPPYDGKRSYRAHPTPRAAYAGMISRMDRDIGRMLTTIDELGLTDNTIVIFTSDNGPARHGPGGMDAKFFNSTGGLRGEKGTLFEGGIRVPAIAKWPGHVPAGTVSGFACAAYDWMPTLMEMINETESIPNGINNHSFAPTLLGRRQPKGTALYWEFAGSGGQQACRFGKWKAIRTGLWGNEPIPKNSGIELYDLVADPAESVDLAEKFPRLRKRAELIMDSAHVPTKTFPFPALDRRFEERSNGQDVVNP